VARDNATNTGAVVALARSQEKERLLHAYIHMVSYRQSYADSALRAWCCYGRESPRDRPGTRITDFAHTRYERQAPSNVAKIVKLGYQITIC
jgi:hypothetical protein